MRRDWERRLARLEHRLGPLKMPRFVVVVNAIDPQRRDLLAPDERIVQDWFRDDNGYVLARERITVDPAEEGQRCEPGGCLIAVIQELHETCEFRDGDCRICAGLDPFTRHSRQSVGMDSR